MERFRVAKQYSTTIYAQRDCAGACVFVREGGFISYANRVETRRSIARIKIGRNTYSTEDDSQEARIQFIVRLTRPSPRINSGSTATGTMPRNKALRALARLRSRVSLTVKIKDWIDANPDSLLEQNEYGATLLQATIAVKAPIEFFQYVLHACPEAALKRAGNGNLPLQFCIQHGFAGYVNALIKMTPESLSQYHDGKLPLHEAILCGTSVISVREIIEGYPEACTRRTKDGAKLPLQLAVDNQRFEVVEILANQFPRALLQMRGGHATTEPMLLTIFGALLKHHEFINGFIGVLVDKCPTAFLFKDRHGNLLLHNILERMQKKKKIRQNHCWVPRSSIAKDESALLAIIAACRTVAKVPDAHFIWQWAVSIAVESW